MEIIENKLGSKPKVSVILIDWNVRESFHSLHYLNDQTFPRKDYEIIWVEFYDRKPKELLDRADKTKKNLFIDKWIILGYPRTTYYHKHFMYNVGIVHSDGKICVICDSDAMFSPTFIERIYKEFEKNPNIILHVDEVRNENTQFYPFNYPSIPQVLAKGCVNWTGRNTTALENTSNLLHEANYGACMCALKEDLIAIGGADEDIDYLGYICGPYEMTFRLTNSGKQEKWLQDEWIYHTWHPGVAGDDNFGGPQNGWGMSSRAMEALDSHRVDPIVENEAIKELRNKNLRSKQELTVLLENQDHAQWEKHQDFLSPVIQARLIEEGYNGFNIIYYHRKYYGLAQDEGAFYFEKVQNKEYKSCYEGISADDVKKLIKRSFVSPSSPWKFFTKILLRSPQN